MNQIVQIAKDNGYDSVFAGYGFMAEDEEFVATIERAGLKFVGPNSSVQARAGKKDEAKRTALEVKVSVTPGVNNVTAPDPRREAQDAQAAPRPRRRGGARRRREAPEGREALLEDLADQILFASYAKASTSSPSTSSAPRCSGRSPRCSRSTRAAASA